MATNAQALADDTAATKKWLLGIVTLGCIGMISMGVTNHARLAALENEREWIKKDIREMTELLRQIEIRLRAFEQRK